MSTDEQSVAEPSIHDAGHDHLIATMPMGTNCVAHSHSEWVPIEAHHVWPRGLGGPDVSANRISICCNGHYAIHEYLRQLMIHSGTVPPELAKHFSPKVKAYAVQGWTEAGKPTTGSSGE